MSRKRALITGISGMDGSHLSDFLLTKDYEIFGLERRSSTKNRANIMHLEDKVHFITGDLSDQNSLLRAIKISEPHEIYNLGAQSFVGESWNTPEQTSDITGLGVLRILEAIRESGLSVKFYQASSSEMFGGMGSGIANESTAFYPRSPYGVSKLYGHWITRNYRESYNMFNCSGILFNHESILKNSPIIVKLLDGSLNIVPIEDLFRTESHKYEGILDGYKNVSVWDGSDWTKIVNGSCYRDTIKKVRLVQTTSSCCETTLDHTIFDIKNRDIENCKLVVGDKLFQIKYPQETSYVENISTDFCKFLGFVAGDGHVSSDGSVIRLTGCDESLLSYYASLLKSSFGFGCTEIFNNGPGKFDGCVNDVFVVDIKVDSNFGKWLRGELYTVRSNEKRVPKFILNSNLVCKKSFFDGYYEADGRKQGHEQYLYKGFTSKSATLCLGLIYLFKSFSLQDVKCVCEYRGGYRYYRIQIRSSSISTKGHHLKKPLTEITKVFETSSEDGWFYDIQTENSSFATGPNLVKIHNSPRRGLEFVTRKITDGVARISLGLSDKLALGNIYAKRDWGYAPDYVEAMWLMLQQDIPDDFVIATGEAHSVSDFLQIAFKFIGVFNWEDYVVVDDKYKRPADVEYLKGDASKAKSVLGWNIKISFEELIKRMVENDIRLLEK